MYAFIKYVLVNSTKINRIQCNNKDNLHIYNKSLVYKDVS